MGNLTTGNEIVDAVSQINFQGDITPRIWRKTITKSNGKPYPLARDVLSDLVYWYRAYEVIDESTQEISMKKKFRDDLLFKSYKQLCDEFGESKRVIRDVLRRLEEIGVIKCHYRTVSYENGLTLNNVMYIELIPEVLRQLTYPDENTNIKVKITDSEKEAENKSESAENGTPLPPGNENVNRGVTYEKEELAEDSKEANEEVEKMSKMAEKRTPLPPSDKNVNRVVTKMSTQNTKNTTEINNNYYNSHLSYPSREEETKGEVCPDEDRMDETTRADEFIKYIMEIRSTREIDDYSGKLAIRAEDDLKEKFLKELPENPKEKYPRSFLEAWYDYENLLVAGKNGGCFCEMDKDEIDIVMSLLYDTLNTTKSTIRISGEEKPTSVVISKLLKLNEFDITYAWKQFKSQTTRIRNQRAYLLTVLYLAKEQSELDISNQVQHDMYGRGD